MNKLIYKIGFCVAAFLLFVMAYMPMHQSYKCMLQLVNYTGEGAYIIVSVIDGSGNYQETLKVIGEDEQWYPDLKNWHSFHKDSGQDIDGITGATIAGGERTVFSFYLDEKYLDKDYTLRIETAVEDQDYHLDDVNLPILSDKLTGTVEGSGYIRYIKLLNK